MTLAGNLNAWSKITITILVIFFGLVFMITPASALTSIYTDGEVHVSWRVSETEGEVQSENSDGVPPPFPKNVVFCEFGEHELDESMPDVTITRVSTQTVVDYIAACEKFIEGEEVHGRARRSLHRQKRAFDFKAIYPGTKWCGTGNIAWNREDLGMLRNLDRCCREHDECPDIIRNGESRGGIRNTRGYTMLNCDCDETFRHCLYDINDFAANTVGGTYFNLLANKCYLPKQGSSTGELQVFQSVPYEPCVQVNLFNALFIQRNC